MATFSVTSTSKSPTLLEVKARQFTLSVDEPPNLGGTDEGPNPVEFVLAALAGCYNVVIQMVAKERDVVIDSLAIDLEGDLDPAKLFGKDVETRPGFQGIRMTVRMQSEASTEDLEAILAEVEQRCPVCDNLRNPTPVAVQLARA